MSPAAGELPNLMVIGAGKCGTTSLHYYLGLHPEITMSRTKELLFFIEEGTWPRGLTWDRSQFPRGTRLRGESSPAYSQWPKHRGVPRRMHATIPEARLIYLVRDPVLRLLSEYRHQLTRREESRSLREVLTRPTASDTYVAAGLYHRQIQEYLRHFAPESLLVVDADDLRARRRRTLQRVFRFLGVDDAFWSPRFRLALHRSDLRLQATPAGLRLKGSLRRLLRPLPFALRGPVERLVLLPLSRPISAPRLDGELREMAQSLFRRDAQALRAHTGLTLGGWCV